MRKLNKVLLLLILMVLTCTSSVLAATEQTSDAQNDCMSLTSKDIVKQCTVEEHWQTLSNETGVPLEQIRATEMAKLKEYNSQNVGGVLRLGDYRYVWLSKKQTFFQNSSTAGKIQVGCEAYCYFDKVVSVVDGTKYATMADGTSYFQITQVSLDARRLSDYDIQISGIVGVQTTTTYTTSAAVNFGLINYGFSGSNNTYYNKVVNINQHMQP